MVQHEEHRFDDDGGGSHPPPTEEDLAHARKIIMDKIVQDITTKLQSQFEVGDKESAYEIVMFVTDQFVKHLDEHAELIFVP